MCARACVRDVEENVQIGANKEQVDHTQQILHEEPSVLIMKDKDDLVHFGSENIQVDDLGTI